MAFLAPILGSLGGAGISALSSGKANSQAQQNNLQQQQAAIQAWQNAIKNFQSWMGENPSPYAGGVHVAQPGAIKATPYQPHPMPASGIFAGGRGAPGGGARPPMGGAPPSPIAGFSGGPSGPHATFGGSPPTTGMPQLPGFMQNGAPPSNGMPPGLQSIIARLGQNGGPPRPMTGPVM